MVDVGAGTGNASLLAAERGARVTGVDPARRLLAVAREQAAARGLEAAFLEGQAAALPVPEAGADLVVSVFGVIFTPDAQAAAAELGRVSAPSGRVVLSAWIPAGALAEVNRRACQAVAGALDAPAGAPPFAWHDRDALTGLLAPHGFAVTVEEEDLSFTGSSAREYLDAELANHPAFLAARTVLEPRGELASLRDELLAILEQANEHPAGFRVTSRYVIVTARRSPERLGSRAIQGLARPAAGNRPSGGAPPGRRSLRGGGSPKRRTGIAEHTGP